MKRRWMKVTAACIALAMFGAIGAACSKSGGEKAVSYMAVDVNPSVSLALDKKDKVVSVYAGNEDAQVLLYGENLVGLKASAALDKIAELSVELGYLNENNYGVNITVEGKADTEEMTAAAKASFEAKAGDLTLSFSTEGTFSLQRRLNAVKEEYPSDQAIQNLGVAKFRLITEAQAVDKTLTVTAAAEMDTDELIALIGKAAENIAPYATEAYNLAVAAAERAYNDAKGSLIDKIWLVPYTKDLANVLTGNRKYGVNNGMIYNMYTDSSRALAAGLAAAEEAALIAEKLSVPASVTDAVAAALNMTAEEKSAFIEEVTVDGEITLASLENYLDRYFKNMTQEQREAAKQEINEVMRSVQAFADEVDAEIADEYKAAIEKLCEDLTSLIPSEIVNIASDYLNEFKELVEDMREAMVGKEPMPAAYAAKQALDDRAEKIMKTMRSELTKDDLSEVEASIEKLNDSLSKLEKTFTDAVTKAENEAKEYLSSLKAYRTAA